jgi:hypothetical protein
MLFFSENFYILEEDQQWNTPMKKLNKQSEMVLRQLIKDLKEPGDGTKIDNTDETFMPVHVDFVWENQHGRIYAIGHHYIQNGDVMMDPEMTFLVNDTGVFPMSFQQDGSIPLYQEAVFENDDEQLAYKPKLQASLNSFANDWMKNIKEQQNLKITTNTLPADQLRQSRER